MTVSIAFEVQATPDEPMHELLAEVDALPYWERQLVIGKVMQLRGQQIIEEAAGALAVQAREDQRQERIRATRARNARTASRVVRDV